MSDRPAVLPAFRNYLLVPALPGPELTDNLTGQGPRAAFQHECAAALAAAKTDGWTAILDSPISQLLRNAPLARGTQLAVFGAAPARDCSQVQFDLRRGAG